MGRRNEPIKGTVAGFIEDAMSEVEDLASEMGEWRDSLEENFSQTEKYETVSQAADILEDVQTPDLPAIAEEIEVETTQDTRTQPTRARRMSNVLSLLSAARDAADEERGRLVDAAEGSDDSGFTDENGDEFETEDENSAKVDELETLTDELDNIIGELEGVVFPGAFG